MEMRELINLIKEDIMLEFDKAGYRGGEDGNGPKFRIGDWVSFESYGETREGKISDITPNIIFIVYMYRKQLRTFRKVNDCPDLKKINKPKNLS